MIGMFVMPMGPSRNRIRAEPLPRDFIQLARRTHFHRPARSLRRIFTVSAQLVVAAKQCQHRFSIRDHDEALLSARSQGGFGECRHFGDGLAPRRAEFFRRGFMIGIVNARSYGIGNRFFGDLRRVLAAQAIDDKVLARIGRHHELHRLAAAHRARERFDRDYIQAATREDPAICVIVLLVRKYPRPSASRSKVKESLHDELPHAKQARFRTRLIAEFRLNLIPDLGQVLVAAQFARVRLRS